ncbi:MAG: hypothetical protein WA965_01900, partial [Mycobacterium sp.]
PGVFVWFAGIGALTVAMSGGFRPRVRRPKVAADVGAAADVSETEVDESDPVTSEVDPADIDPATVAIVVDDESEPAPVVDAEPVPPPVLDEVPPLDELDPEEHFVVDEQYGPGVVDDADSPDGGHRGGTAG